MSTRLYRSRHDRMLAGVAGGLAEMWHVDPSLVRIVWAVLVFLTGGIALLVYIIMAIVVPEEEDVRAPWPPPPSAPPTPGTPEASAGTGAASPPGYQPYGASGAGQEGRAARREARAARQAAGERDGLPASAIGGVILVLLGVFFLAREWLPQIDFDWVWPLILVGIGVVLLVSALAGRPNDRSGPP